jgi:hypothetical protein
VPTIAASREPDRAPSTIDRRDGRDDRDPTIGDYYQKKSEAFWAAATHPALVQCDLGSERWHASKFASVAIIRG